MPFWAAVFSAFVIVEIMSARGMPFSFSMYSRTERISLLIGWIYGKKKAGQTAHLLRVVVKEGRNVSGTQNPCQAQCPVRRPVRRVPLV